jgi:exopolyphosphatase / guanosine-5'-triphosphate,3'-diphosphate pyrophosphatase
MTRLAAIDVGTNSVRLYVAEKVPGGMRHVDRDLIITRLGQGVDSKKRLGEKPLTRTLDAIARYHDRASELGAERIRIAATSAVRDATNRDAFFAGVRSLTGLEAEVLSGEEEARLSFLGATNDLSDGGPYLVLDIGGGSTEFVRGERKREAWISIDVGSVRLTERHIRSDPPAPAEMEAVVADADEAVERAKGVVGDSARTLVGLAGTITTIAAVALGLKRYDRDAIHHARLDLGTIRSIDAMLREATVEQRKALPVMPRGREDVIAAGSTILRRVMEGFGFGEVLVSEADILDGLVLDLLLKAKRFPARRPEDS